MDRIVWSGAAIPFAELLASGRFERADRWALLSDDGTVLRHGEVDTATSLTVGFPEVICPVVVTWVAWDPRSGDHVHRWLSIRVIPREVSEELRRGLNRLRIGVHDRSCAFQAMLDSAGVPYQDVSERYALDWFSGDLLLLGGDMDELERVEVERSLYARYRLGLSIIQHIPAGAVGAAKPSDRFIEDEPVDGERAIHAMWQVVYVSGGKDWPNDAGCFHEMMQCLNRFVESSQSTQEDER